MKSVLLENKELHIHSSTHTHTNKWDKVKDRKKNINYLFLNKQRIIINSTEIRCEYNSNNNIIYYTSINWFF